MRNIFFLLFTLLGTVHAHAAPMGEADARHLLNRTGFGAPPAAVTEFSRLSREAAVERLLASARTTPTLQPPEQEFTSPAQIREIKQFSEEEKKAFQRSQFLKGAELRGWWLQEMLQTPSPLTERMTLFWHNHFVSSQQKVKSGRLMLEQNLLLRRHALGHFGELLHAVAKDPAMIIYLDAATNRKGQPNENFAREVMELFTLGEGNYSEQDIKEAARAFTGWSIDRETGKYRWRAAMHDAGEKTVLGNRGNFDGDAVLDLLLRQAATAEFISGKLWREFVSPAPDPAQVRQIARVFRSTGYDIRQALRALLLSEGFWSPRNRGVLVKSPVDLVVGSMRTLEIDVRDSLPLVFVTRNLGQDLMAPPNVKGWPGGNAWINASTLLARRQFIERLLRNDDASPQARRNGNAMAMQARRQEESNPRVAFGKGAGHLESAARQRLLQAANDIRFNSHRWLSHFDGEVAVANALLAVPAVSPVPPETQGMALVRALALDPSYQLK